MVSLSYSVRTDLLAALFDLENEVIELQTEDNTV
jgi:hypothetical protein